MAGPFFLAVTVVGWGLNWAVMKVLLREWPPLFARGISGVAAGLILAAVVVASRQSLRVPRAVWPRLTFAAFTNVFAWMGFGTMAMNYLAVSEAALTVYTMPLWATLFAWPILGKRPGLYEIAALVLGMAGIVVLFAGHCFALGPHTLFGIALALAAAVAFAFGSVIAREPLPIDPIALVAWQVGLGCAPMIVLGLLFEKPDLTFLSLPAFGALAYTTLIPMGLCYLTWFATLRRFPPSTAAIGTLTVPVVGVVAAATMLGEPLGLREVAAAALTLGGVALVIRR
ncbi:DMT family transporter [Variibacter gotjawalensis]|uniref:DMT family transporter n=1 Tax=Variibacter gotjawalensis TaxID=1333996 RepID=UPI001E0447A6|nr:drug/metabolite transporter (DMT)-like permease [Variibacter gotjawalensis]